MTFRWTPGEKLEGLYVIWDEPGCIFHSKRHRRGVFSISKRIDGVCLPFRNASRGDIFHCAAPRRGVFSISKRLGRMYFPLGNASGRCIFHSQQVIFHSQQVIFRWWSSRSLIRLRISRCPRLLRSHWGTSSRQIHVKLIVKRGSSVGIIWNQDDV